MTKCVDKCPGEYRQHGTSCVLLCPPSTYNESGVCISNIPAYWNSKNGERVALTADDCKNLFKGTTPYSTVEKECVSSKPLKCSLFDHLVEGIV